MGQFDWEAVREAWATDTVPLLGYPGGRYYHCVEVCKTQTTALCQGTGSSLKDMITPGGIPWKKKQLLGDGSELRGYLDVEETKGALRGASQGTCVFICINVYHMHGCLHVFMYLEACVYVGGGICV